MTRWNRKRSVATIARRNLPWLVTPEVPGHAAHPGNSQIALEENMAAAKIHLSPEEWKKVEGAA
jgi:hypothetical protein